MSYAVNGVDRPARSMKPVSCKCPFMCTRYVSEDDRNKIFDGYWNLASKNLQRQFISNHCRCIKKKSGNTKLSSRRKETIVYHFTVGEAQVRVCKKFFLNTLDIGEKTVTIVVKNADVRNLVSFFPFLSNMS